VKGPIDSAYDNYNIIIHLYFPATFPYHPPTIRVGCDIFHPNVCADSRYLRLRILDLRSWRAHYDIAMVLNNVHKILAFPQMDLVVNEQAGRVFFNKIKYNSMVHLKMEPHRSKLRTVLKQLNKFQVVLYMYIYMYLHLYSQ
jgi:ubiquitin-protein ligase